MKRAFTIVVTALLAGVGLPAQASPAPVTGQTIVINEAVPFGPGGARDEYVEFQNVTDTEIDLTDYQLRFTPPVGPAVSVLVFPMGFTVAAGEMFLYMGLDYSSVQCGGGFGTVDIPSRGTISLHKPNRELVAKVTVPQDPNIPRTPCE